MEQAVLKVEGMTCSHCEQIINKAVGALDIAAVSADAKTKRVSVTYDPDMVSLDAIRKTIEEQGYEVT